MGSVISFLDVPRRLREAAAQEQALAVLLSSSADSFPGSGYRPGNHKKWMEGLGASNVRVNQVVWPGTHDSATNGISAAPLAQCQTLYPVDVVLDDVKRFLEETTSEFVILEIRTEYDQQDPPEFARYLVDRLGDHLIRQDDRVFNKTTAKLLPKRVICVWKPRQSPAPKPGEPLLASLAVEPVTRWIRRFARLFISRVFVEGHGNKLQVFSTDFIDENFVNACIGFTKARIDGARAR
ncbi:hypothetical protein SETIT_8G066000v2 [Setaria italica]|uniref:Phosphatidylinositol-specific phospholipase C X domain-containing protein n=1 Tax=Setaria italica TaxID=4555 RepID=A0A368S4V2_SETIT|nr:hypothetical protein SETIT_8G066000v2 [Setaria italica]